MVMVWNYVCKYGIVFIGMKMSIMVWNCKFLLWTLLDFFEMCQFHTIWYENVDCFLLMWSCTCEGWKKEKRINSRRPGGRQERECCLLVLNLVSSTLPCIRRPRPRLKKHNGFPWRGENITGLLKIIISQPGFCSPPCRVFPQVIPFAPGCALAPRLRVSRFRHGADTPGRPQTSITMTSLTVMMHRLSP